MPTLVLLGDSILDNGPYVGAGEAVTDALRALLPDSWKAVRLAVDGSTAEDVLQQMTRIRGNAGHFIISCGGNDALGHLGALQAGCATVHGALSTLAPVVRAFREDYRRMLADAVARCSRVTVCTVYDAVPGLDAATQLALALFNDVILREAIGARVDVIDMRWVATQSEDFAAVSPIEPSASGARKIARAILNAVVSDTARPASRMHTTGTP